MSLFILLSHTRTKEKRWRNILANQSYRSKFKSEARGK